jgi:hypothetical protein
MTSEVPRGELKPGVMPTPRYFPFELAPNRVEQWIGIEAFSLEGQVKPFIFWRPIRRDLTIPQDRDFLARTVAEMKLRSNTDVAIGPNIVLSECDPATGRVVTDEEKTHLGVYVEREKRFTAEFMTPEQANRLLDPQELQAAVDKAKAYLPATQGLIPNGS